MGIWGLHTGKGVLHHVQQRALAAWHPRRRHRPFETATLLKKPGNLVRALCLLPYVRAGGGGAAADWGATSLP